jgi:hypothetical protein
MSLIFNISTLQSFNTANGMLAVPALVQSCNCDYPLSMESILLWSSTFFYLFSFCSTLLALRAKQLRPGRFSFVAIFLGVLCQSWFLALRGHQEQACPIRTFPEMLLFLSWSIGWFYLLIGSTYRILRIYPFTLLASPAISRFSSSEPPKGSEEGGASLLSTSLNGYSLMGTFTAPLILLLQSIGFLLLAPVIPIQSLPNSWIEAHAAFSLVAFGALGLACISALMFLFQEWQLKSQAPAPIFHFLPPMRLLEIKT